MDHPHLDVLFEDEFSRFVADGLAPEVVVNASRNHINLGIRSADESVDVFVGGLSAAEARALATQLEAAADSLANESGEKTTWTPIGSEAEEATETR